MDTQERNYCLIPTNPTASQFPFALIDSPCSQHMMMEVTSTGEFCPFRSMSSLYRYATWDHIQRIFDPDDETLKEVKRYNQEETCMNDFIIDNNYQLLDCANKITCINPGRAFYATPEK